MALDGTGSAVGQLYVDDEHTYAYWDESGGSANFHHREFVLTSSGTTSYVLSSRASSAFGDRVSHTTTLHDALLDSDTYYGHIARGTEIFGRQRHQKNGLISSALNAVAGIFHTNNNDAASSAGTDEELPAGSADPQGRQNEHAQVRFCSYS